VQTTKIDVSNLKITDKIKDVDNIVNQIIVTQIIVYIVTQIIVYIVTQIILTQTNRQTDRQRLSLISLHGTNDYK